MKTRAETLVQRVRQSELFPRIRDTEQLMMDREEKFLKRQEKKRKKRKENKAPLKSGSLPPIQRATAVAKKDLKQPQEGLFSKFIVNSDPSNSKFVPFDEVYYPNIFNEEARKVPPHAIDTLWMLGFQHLKNEGRP